MKNKETKSQIYLSNLLLVELNEVFLKMNLNIVDGRIVSISKITVTRNLFEARIFLNIFPMKGFDVVLKKFNDSIWDIKKNLVEKIKNKTRSMPQIYFHIDDSLEHMFKMAELFKKI